MQALWGSRLAPSSLFRRLSLSLRAFRLYDPQLSYKPSPILAPSTRIDEELIPGYRLEEYCSIQLGETLHDRYQIAAKIGYGRASTVWLARDLSRFGLALPNHWCSKIVLGAHVFMDLSRWRWQAHQFVTLKVCISPGKDVAPELADRERAISEHIANADPSHEGRDYVRLAIDSFELRRAGAAHPCLVYEPMREPVWLLRMRMIDERFDSGTVKELVKLLLSGLDYLHTKCHVIHIGEVLLRPFREPRWLRGEASRLIISEDLKLDNILVNFENETVISDFVKEELGDPSPRKEVGDRTIYLSRNNFGHPRGAMGTPKIADFGLAVRGDVSQPHNHLIQPPACQAPEVILRAGWTYSADIWNLGVLIWDLLDDETLFTGEHENEGSHYTSRAHIGKMIALLGPPPQELLDRGERTSEYFNRKGTDNLIHLLCICYHVRKIGETKRPDLVPRDMTLESLEVYLRGEDKRLFLQFIKRMLRWLPEERSTTRELLDDPWLNLSEDVDTI